MLFSDVAEVTILQEYKALMILNLYEQITHKACLCHTGLFQVDTDHEICAKPFTHAQNQKCFTKYFTPQNPTAYFVLRSSFPVCFTLKTF